MVSSEMFLGLMILPKLTACIIQKIIILETQGRTEL